MVMKDDRNKKIIPKNIKKYRYIKKKRNRTEKKIFEGE